VNSKQEILDNLSFNVEAFSSRFEFVVSELRESCLFNRVVGNTTIENGLIAAGCGATNAEYIYSFLADYSALLETIDSCETRLDLDRGVEFTIFVEDCFDFAHVWLKREDWHDKTATKKAFFNDFFNWIFTFTEAADGLKGFDYNGQTIDFFFYLAAILRASVKEGFYYL
jgi:hypothetical protein